MGKTRAQKQQEADDAAVERTRERFGDAEAAILNRELIIKRTEPGGSWQSKLPVPMLILAGLLLFFFEAVSKAPEFFLTYERFQATQAEYEAKLLQPDIAAAQLKKAQFEADAASVQPALAATQLDKTKFDTTVSRYAADAAPNQPKMVAVQLEKARNDALTSAIQPDLTNVQLQKIKLETLATAYQPKLSELQTIKLGIDTKLAGVQLPLAIQATAMSSEYLNAFSPMINSILGVVGKSSGQPQGSPTGATPVSTADPTQTLSEDYVTGQKWRDKWESYVADATGSTLDGAKFWAGVRSDKRPHSCTDGIGGQSQEFRDGCTYAQKFLANVDKYNKTNPDFHAGWNSR